MQALEVAGQSSADDVGTGSKKLSELDIARPQPRQRRRQPRFGGAGRAALEQPHDANERPGADRRHDRINNAEDAFAGENETGAGKPQKVRRSRDHKRQPECSATMPPLMDWNETRAKAAARNIAAKACGLGKRRIDSTR